MLWLKSEARLGRHPKLLRLAGLLDTAKPAAIGHLHLLWWFALEFAPSGDLSGATPQEMADAALWPGEPMRFVEALQQAGFLDGLALHDWADYGGRLQAATEAHRLHQSEYRERQRSRQRDSHVTEAGSTRDSLDQIRVDQRRSEKMTSTTTPAGSNGKLDPDLAKVAAAYENNAGVVITEMVADGLKDLVGEYPADWIVQALKAAKDRGKNVVGVNYLRPILDEWRRDGGPRPAGRGRPSRDRTPRLGSNPEEGF